MKEKATDREKFYSPDEEFLHKEKEKERDNFTTRKRENNMI